MGLGVDELRGKPPAIARGPVTGRVTRVDGQGVWVVPVDGDLRTPIGPCRGPSDIPVGTVVMVIYTQERPWVFGAELLTPLNAEARELALIALLEATAQAWDEAVAQATADALAAHAASTTGVHGIPDTAALETQSGAQDRADAAQAAAETTAADALALHAGATDNPHAVTKAQVGLGDVDNTSDADKPVSTAAAAALGEKLDADVYQDSGRRLVVAAGDVTDLPDLEVVVRRRGDVVTIFTRESAGAMSGATEVLTTLPAGFRPAAPFVPARVVNQSGDIVSAASLTVAATGAMRLVPSLGARHHSALTYLTSDTWPATLPGTEDT